MSDGKVTTPPDDRSYATFNGFYEGDEVELPDGSRGFIEEIVCKVVRADAEATYSVVRSAGELWLDGWLTRV